MTGVDVSLICALYNEGPTLKSSIQKILGTLEKVGKRWEIIFVEDKSTDDTREQILAISKRIKNATLVLHKKNEGRGSAISDGILVSRGKICGFLDVDCEVSPDYIPIFIGEIEKGFDMAVATRYYERSLRNISRFIASKIYSLFVKALLRVDISDTESGYKFFNREKILTVLKKTRDKGWFWDTEICARAYFSGLKISEVPVLFVRRIDKKSTVKLLTDSFQYLKKIVAFRMMYLEK